MTLSILAYGDPILRKIGKSINKDYPRIKGINCQYVGNYV